MNWTDSWDHYKDIVGNHFLDDWGVKAHKAGSHGVAVYIDVKLKRLGDAFNLRKAYEYGQFNPLTEKPFEPKKFVVKIAGYRWYVPEVIK